jgi:hypothetical protein
LDFRLSALALAILKLLCAALSFNRKQVLPLQLISTRPVIWTASALFGNIVLEARCASGALGYVRT